jgi:hypothetical protein
MKRTRDHKLIFLIKKSIPLLALVSSAASADQMHYRNVITGERAQGLGGAYTGVADDASGVFYNPGGLAFAQSNDISGSANAFYSKKVTFKKAFLGVSDFVEESGGTFAPFFGVMQKLDKFLPGLVGGFAYYTLDTELKDQDNLKSYGALQRFHRAANIRAATFAATGALGYRISPSMGIGLSLGYIKADELTQVSQNSIVGVYTDPSTGQQKGPVYQVLSLRESLIAHGAQLGFGVQWAPSAQLSVGATVRSGSYASQKYSQVVDNVKVDAGVIDALPATATSDNPLGSMPLELRAGIAWFASPRLLVTSDIDFHEEVSDTSSITENLYSRESVTNFALGTEYYMTASIPFRLGFFTNYDATPTPTTSKKGQADHIDYMGTSMFLAWAQPNSQISAGIVVQKGTGKSQKNASDSSLQDIDALAYTLGFSATHSF